MRRAPRILTVGALTMATALFAGCVPQDRYDQLLMTNRSLDEQLVAADERLSETETSLRAAQDQLAQTRAAYSDLEGRYTTMRNELGALETASDEYLRRISGIEMGPLPAEIESAIEALAAAHPNLITFDAGAGMVRLSSDFTFDLGSVALKQDATTTLAQLARILDDPAVQELEVRVVGHTDNVKIGKPETRRQHPTNMHLSVHRAIAVRDVLLSSGLDAYRMQVAGYGAERPIVPNNGSRGAAENRRVEIFLAAMPAMGLENVGRGTETTAAPEIDRIEPMK